jgi:probable S-adenosylmethionine-dependent methyltransferase, YraL family
MLSLVPTPIGNLKDITLRAIDVLKESDLILTEDTRVSGRLLKEYSISTKMMSYHAHNEHKSLDKIIDLLKEGLNLALITDAGTPAISDPGFLLVRACHEEGIDISCLPGATAIMPALAMSGLPCDKFYFEGFLPHKKGRQTRWISLASMSTTIVLYESTHRIKKLIGEAKTHLGESRQISVIKEISKIHERIFRGSIKDVEQVLSEANTKGEFVVIIGPPID